MARRGQRTLFREQPWVIFQKVLKEPSDQLKNKGNITSSYYLSAMVASFIPCDLLEHNAMRQIAWRRQVLVRTTNQGQQQSMAEKVRRRHGQLPDVGSGQKEEPYSITV